MFQHGEPNGAAAPTLLRAVQISSQRITSQRGDVELDDGLVLADWKIGSAAWQGPNLLIINDIMDCI